MKYHFNFQKRYSKRSQGFTLLEMLVAVGIFSIVVAVITVIFNSIFLSRKIIVSRERLQSDSNSIIEIISKNIRTSRPYYEYYANNSIDLTNKVEVLALIDKNDNKITFSKSTAYCYNGQSACLVLAIGDTADWINVTPEGVNLIDVGFYIEPVQDPFILAAERPDKQPLVTVVLKTEAKIGKKQGEVSNLIQASLSSRIYQERIF